MAGPHAAGVVALVRGTDTGLNAQQAIKTLEREADTIACPEVYDYTDDGVADATCEGGATGTASSVPAWSTRWRQSPRDALREARLPVQPGLPGSSSLDVRDC